MTSRSATSKQAWSKHSIRSVSVIPHPHTVMMWLTSIGVRAGVGVVVPITMVGAPGVDGWEGIETVIGDPCDGCQETTGNSSIGVIDAKLHVEEDGAQA